MKIGGFMKQTFVDFPSVLSAIIFTSGCNLNCWYCHNRSLISGNQQAEESFDEVLKFLKSRAGFLEGVVFSGGEPTLQSDLKNRIIDVRNLGYKIKLDTNGTNPEILKSLLDKKIIDYVAMDLKNSFNKYEKTCCVIDSNIQGKIEQSIKILHDFYNCETGKAMNFSYEFRTTFAPDVKLEDIEEIAKLAKEAPKFYIQKYNPVNDKVVLIPHSYPTFQKALEVAKKYNPNSFLRGL